MRRVCHIVIIMLFLSVFAISTIQHGFYHIKAEETYTEEEKAQAKAWLSAHGYPPTRAGAAQAYQDYLDGKFDDDSQVQAAAEANNVTTQAKQEDTATTADAATTENQAVEDTKETYSDDKQPGAVDDDMAYEDLKEEDSPEQKTQEQANEHHKTTTEKTDLTGYDTAGKGKSMGWKNICFICGELLVVIVMIIQIARKK